MERGEKQRNKQNKNVEEKKGEGENTFFSCSLLVAPSPLPNDRLKKATVAQQYATLKTLPSEKTWDPCLISPEITKIVCD